MDDWKPGSNPIGNGTKNCDITDNNAWQSTTIISDLELLLTYNLVEIPAISLSYRY